MLPSVVELTAFAAVSSVLFAVDAVDAADSWLCCWSSTGCDAETECSSVMVEDDVTVLAALMLEDAGLSGM
jgi:hypothetical protein